MTNFGKIFEGALRATFGKRKGWAEIQEWLETIQNIVCARAVNLFAQMQ